MLSLFRRPPPPRAAPVPRRIRELELVTARLIRSGFAGDYHAAFHGQGIEFSQVREYQPGDDVRTIDWNVTARSGAPHVKQFVEERDLTIVIACDISGSMGFGSLDRRKIDLARELIAVLAFSAEQNRDRVGLILFESDIRSYHPPGRGRSHVRLLVRDALVSGGEPSGQTRFDRLGTFLDRIARRRSVVIVLSDFLDEGFEKVMKAINARHDLIAISLRDPREQRLPDRGLVTLVDNESGARKLVDLARLASKKSMRPGERTRENLKRAGVDTLELSTVVPYERDLLRFFEQRIARRS